MINPIALATMALGVVLLPAGAVLVSRRRKMTGALLVALGLVAIAMPFFVSLYLASMD